MICRKCSRELPEDAIYCCYCGIKQEVSKKKTRTHANGIGTIILTIVIYDDRFAPSVAIPFGYC